jgi:hypothetical protein
MDIEELQDIQYRMYCVEINQFDAQIVLSIFRQPVHVSGVSRPTSTTDSHLKRIISTNCCTHTAEPPDDRPRYDRNMKRLTKYTKYKLCLMLSFHYTNISRRTHNKTLKNTEYILQCFLSELQTLSRCISSSICSENVKTKRCINIYYNIRLSWELTNDTYKHTYRASAVVLCITMDECNCCCVREDLKRNPQ